MHTCIYAYMSTWIHVYMYICDIIHIWRTYNPSGATGLATHPWEDLPEANEWDHILGYIHVDRDTHWPHNILIWRTESAPQGTCTLMAETGNDICEAIYPTMHLSASPFTQIMLGTSLKRGRELNAVLGESIGHLVIYHTSLTFVMHLRTLGAGAASRIEGEHPDCLCLYWPHNTLVSWTWPVSQENTPTCD